MNSVTFCRRRFCSAGTLHSQSWEAESQHSKVGGSSGARGPFTRNPAESGSTYGMSVFVDEYAARKRH